MANWNFKNLDAISSLCKSRSEDTALPDISRELFAKAFVLTNDWKRSAHMVTARHVEQACDLLCAACKTTRLCQCRELKGYEVLSCPLLRGSEPGPPDSPGRPITTIKSNR